MKTYLVAFGFIVALTPVVTLAATVSNQVQTLSAVVAALEAQELAQSGHSLACAVYASAQQVKVGEQFVVAWSSVGAMDPIQAPGKALWNPNGATVVAVDRPGTWLYKFEFYDKTGATTTCQTTVTATQ